MLHTVNAKEYMTATLVTFRPGQDVLDAINLLLEKEISGAPVVDNMGEVVGMLSEKDCLKIALNAGYDQSSGGTVNDFMTPRPVCVDAEDSIVDVAETFMRSPFKICPVIEDNRLIGQISRRDVLRAIQRIRNG